MVRISDATPLYLSALSAADEPVVTVRVDKVEYWSLEYVTVIFTPDGSLVGAPFATVIQAMGQLKKFLPHPVESHEYLDVLKAYVVGPLDDDLLGKSEIQFNLHSKSVSTRHSPGLAVAPVTCRATEPAEKGGRWLPVSVLRPFVPPSLRNDEEAVCKVRALMSQGKHVPFVHEGFRRAPRSTSSDSDVDPSAGKKRKHPSSFETAADLLARQDGEGSGGSSPADSS